MPSIEDLRVKIRNRINDFNLNKYDLSDPVVLYGIMEFIDLQQESSEVLSDVIL